MQANGKMDRSVLGYIMRQLYIQKSKSWDRACSGTALFEAANFEAANSLAELSGVAFFEVAFSGVACSEAVFSGMVCFRMASFSVAYSEAASFGRLRRRFSVYCPGQSTLAIRIPVR